MVLTPADVEQKAFTQALRGYHMDEVDDFLDEVVATIRNYDQRIRDAQERIRALEGEVNSRGQDESSISRAFIAAQNAADEIIAKAEAEAVTIRDRASTEAGEVLAERDAEVARIRAEIAGHRNLIGSIRSRLADLSGRVSGSLDEMEAVVDGAGDQFGAPPIEEKSPAVEQVAEPSELFAQVEIEEPQEVRSGTRPWERG